MSRKKVKMSILTGRRWLSIFRRERTSANNVLIYAPANDGNGLAKRDMISGPTRDHTAGLLHLIHRAASLIFHGCGAVPAWHDTGFMVA